jgi:hypothetical protein
MGIAALILGIIGVVLCWIPAIGWVGVVLALVALILGIVALKKGIKGLGIAGLILGIVGLGWGLYVQIMTIMAVSAIDDSLQGLEAGLNDPALQQQLQQGLDQAMQEAAQQAQQQ